jgi:hypothetical protein
MTISTSRWTHGDRQAASVTSTTSARDDAMASGISAAQLWLISMWRGANQQATPPASRNVTSQVAVERSPVA